MQTPEPYILNVGDVLVNIYNGQKAIVTDKYLLGAAWKSYYDILVMNVGTLKAYDATTVSLYYKKVDR